MKENLSKINSIRFTIPALTISIMVLAILAAFYISKNSSYSNTDDKVEKEIRSKLSFIQGASEKFIDLNITKNLYYFTSSLASTSDVELINIIDKDDVVIASNNYSDVGKNWRVLSKPFNEDHINEVKSTRTIRTQRIPGQNSMEGYVSICNNIGVDSLRKVVCGFAVYKVNLGYYYKKTDDLLIEQGVFFTVGIVAVVFVLFVMIYFMINRHGNKIVNVLYDFNNGNNDVRINETGLNEIKQIKQSINSVLDKVVENKDIQLEKEERLRAVFDTSLDAILTINKHGIIESINNATEKLLGYNKSDLIGENIKIITPEPYRSNHDGYLENYLNTGNKKVIGFNRELTAVTKDGVNIPISLAVTEMNLRGNIYFTGVLRDISKEVKLRESMRQITDELFKSNLSLKNISRTDPLTGLFNRRYYDESLNAEIRRATRQKIPLSLLLLDIDYFKLYNDHYGHQQGDECLQMVAELLKKNFMRAGELPARYGGEEFSVILPNTDSDEACKIADSFREKLWNKEIRHKMSKVSDRVTVSIGVSTLNLVTDIEITNEKLIISADKALYDAKVKGRNTVCSNVITND